MPKNNKRDVIMKKVSAIECPCGFTKDCERECDVIKMVRRHARVCETARIMREPQAKRSIEVMNNYPEGRTETTSITSRVIVKDRPK